LLETWFLDRDGTINRKDPAGGYVTSWEQFSFLPGALDALRRLAGADKRVVVVTNQRGIARGRVSAQAVARIHARMVQQVRAEGGRIDAVYTCPHHRDWCACRKPKPGLFQQAKEDFPDIEFERAVVVGDSMSDVQAGATIGARTVLLRGMPEVDEVLGAQDLRPDLIVASLREAVDALA